MADGDHGDVVARLREAAGKARDPIAMHLYYDAATKIDAYRKEWLTVSCYEAELPGRLAELRGQIENLQRRLFGLEQEHARTRAINGELRKKLRKHSATAKQRPRARG